MVRNSQRLSNSAHKRNASTVATPVGVPKKAKKTTLTKSQFFKASKKGGDRAFDSASSDDVSSEEANISDFEGGTESTESSLEEGDSDYDNAKKPKNSHKSTPRDPTVALAANSSKSQELWRPGVGAGLGPGQEVIIKKPKARSAGKTPYSDETIHPNTLLFLGDLKANNDRQWLKMHDADFRQAERDWHSFVEKLTDKLIEIDDTIPELPVKDVIFRIYRDIRFSRDPTPYKPHFCAAWSRTGRKGPYASYYVQIAPNASFVDSPAFA